MFEGIMYLLLAMGIVLELGFGIFAVLLYKRAFEQPVKSRSVSLLYITLLGNALGTGFLCVSLVCAAGFQGNESHLRLILYIGLGASEIIALPLCLGPYILRYYFRVWSVGLCFCVRFCRSMRICSSQPRAGLRQDSNLAT